MKDKSVVKPKTKVMNYVIKKIPAHPLRFGAVFNFDFVNEIKKSIKDEGIEMFKNTIFGPYLNIPNCNFQGQITKCMLLLEVQQENKNLLHVRHGNRTVLKFSIKDFAIVTGLKCKGNVKDFSYSNPLRAGYYKDISLMLLQALNVWTYECASSLNLEFAVKVANGNPRICNWRVVAVKPKFGTFISSIFSENACSNIVPTPDEVEALDLPNIQDAHTPEPSTTAVDAKEIQTKDSSGFEDFSRSPLGHLFRRSSRVFGTSSPSPSKRRKKIDTPKTKLRPPINQSFSMPDEAPTPAANVSFVHVSSQVQKDKSVYPDIEKLKQHMKEYVDNKFEYLVTLIKANYSKLMNSRHREDDQQPKDLPIMSKTLVYLILTLKTRLKNHQEMNDVSELQSSDANIHHTAEITKHKDDASGQTPQHFFEGTMNEDASNKVQHNTNQSVPDPDSTTSATISSETQEAIDTIIVDLGRLPIPAKPVSAVNSQELTDNHSFLSNNQLPTDIPITEIVVRYVTNTPLARNRMPSKIYKSPYLTSFGSMKREKRSWRM
ncbi:hypothetical protein H5410_022724 [Solanum commersonii]|uniref:DUF1985 domain-containing protein n=1 Tax=Solanum commersonii TaxID=4109 RepID=A0A9J5ZEV4_SOLCO|nr:hypothetical protein H5410_022724 [Solanum commersonii]